MCAFTFDKLQAQALPNMRVCRYRIITKVLGTGAFSKVKLGMNMQTNERVAIKIILKENIRQRNLSLRVKKEVSIMKQLNHPHVAKVTDVLQSPNEIFIVMEYISRGELRSEVAKKGFGCRMQPTA